MKLYKNRYSIHSLCVSLCALVLVATLTVPCHAKAAFSHGGREEKRIALTFDDGPHPRYTPRILELLEKHGIKATFFMIGCNAKLYPEVVKAVDSGGHEIGNHTFSHPHMKRITAEALKEEIKKTEAVFEALGVAKPHLFRPPEGFRSAQQIKATEELGYRMVVWSLDTHDWQGKTKGELTSFVLSNVQGGDVLLFHDYVSGKNTTITALEELIPKLLEDGYQFVTVSELMC